MLLIWRLEGLEEGMCDSSTNEDEIYNVWDKILTRKSYFDFIDVQSLLSILPSKNVINILPSHKKKTNKL